jgi:hypothetical protein
VKELEERAQQERQFREQAEKDAQQERQCTSFSACSRNCLSCCASFSACSRKQERQQKTFFSHLKSNDENFSKLADDFYNRVKELNFVPSEDVDMLKKYLQNDGRKSINHDKRLRVQLEKRPEGSQNSMKFTDFRPNNLQGTPPRMKCSLVI